VVNVDAMLTRNGEKGKRAAQTYAGSVLSMFKVKKKPADHCKRKNDVERAQQAGK